MAGTLISPASVSKTQVSIVAETNRGETPTTAAFSILAQLDTTSFDQVQAFTRSAELASDRQGGRQIGGTIDASGPLGLTLKMDPAIRGIFESMLSTAMSNPVVNGSQLNGVAHGSTLAFVSGGARAAKALTYTGLPANNDTIVLVSGSITWTLTWKTTLSIPAVNTEILIGGTFSASVTNAVAVVSALQDWLNPAGVTFPFAARGNAGVLTFSYYINDATVGNAATVTSAGANQTGSGTMSGGSAGQDTITATGGTLDFRQVFHANDKLVIAGATTAANNYTASEDALLASVGQQVLTFFTGDFTAEAFAGGSATSLTSQSFFNKSGGSTRKFFTAEVAYTDLSPVVYEYFRGMEVNTGAITVPTSGEVKIDFGMVGLTGLMTNTQGDRSNNYSGTTATSVGTYTVAAATVPFSASVAGCSLTRNGVTSVDIESATINVNNNRATKFALGQQTGAFVEEGDIDVDLSFNAYFKDKTTYLQYLAATRLSLELTLIDQQNGHRLVLAFDQVVLTAAPKGLSGRTVTTQMKAFAEKSPTYGAKMRTWWQPAP